MKHNIQVRENKMIKNLSVEPSDTSLVGRACLTFLLNYAVTELKSIDSKSDDEKSNLSVW